MYLLDTNICIHFLKNEFEIPAKINKAGISNCFVSEIVFLELYYGASNSAVHKKTENYLKVKNLEYNFDERIFTIRPVFEIFSEQKARLRKLGTPISDFDLLIGCTALVNDLILVSRNTKEMSRIEGLKIENWIDS